MKGGNPFAAYKSRKRLSYRELAARLGISVSYAKQLGSGHGYGPSSAMALQFERRTRGELPFDRMVRWGLRRRRRRTRRPQTPPARKSPRTTRPARRARRE